MEKSFDLKVVEFEEQLLESVNESGLPLICVQYVLSELMHLVNLTLEKTIAEEKLNLATSKENSEIRN